MTLFEGIEKLINEHGSAAILHERLSLAAEKYAALESQIEQLKKENERLTEGTKKAAVEIERLRNIVEKECGKLSAEEDAILKLYAETDRWICASELARHLGMSAVKTQYYLDRLLKAKFLQYPMMISDMSETSFHIDHKGREYVIQNGLVT